jgi:hypothetical protein
MPRGVSRYSTRVVTARIAHGTMHSPRDLPSDIAMIPSHSAAPTRRLAHTRQIVCTGYVRSDGLFDIEGRMIDTRADHADLLFKQVPAGEAVHAMCVIVTIDDKRVIRRIEARTDSAPTPYCAEINQAYARLEGVMIGGGFMKEVKARLGGAAGCTHLTELLGPIATTAIQTLMGVGKTRDVSSMLDSCHAWRADGEVVRFLRLSREGNA